SFTFRLVDPVPVGWRRIMAERFDALCVHVIEGGDAEAFPRLATELYLFECAHPNSARDKPAAFRLSARSTRGLSTDHDGNAVVFRARLQSRGDVGGVAKYRVVKAEVRSHIADHARSGIQSDADVERHVFAAVLVRLAFELLIELVARAPDRLRQRPRHCSGGCATCHECCRRGCGSLRGDAWRHSVRLRENDVEADRDGAEFGETGDAVRDDRARPGPLADLLEARFVDVDNDDRPQPRLAWPQGLVEAEGPQPDFLERRRV